MKAQPAPDKDRILLVDGSPDIHDAFRTMLIDDPHAQGKFELDCARDIHASLALMQQSVLAPLPYTLAFIGPSQKEEWTAIEIARQIWAVDSRVQIVICAERLDLSPDALFEAMGTMHGWLTLKTPLDRVEIIQLSHVLTQKWHLQRLAESPQGVNSAAEMTATENPVDAS
ncbi:MAG: hypothetical protein JF617_18025, partial [Burkholderiales bacterium]|nr:hypothetical protein [Burkholderiales bacterium]